MKRVLIFLKWTGIILVALITMLFTFVQLSWNKKIDAPYPEIVMIRRTIFFNIIDLFLCFVKKHEVSKCIAANGLLICNGRAFQHKC